MKIFLALVITGVSALASTRITDTVYLSDGITPASGRMVVQGFQRSANGKTALTSTVTVPIGPGGAVDFRLEGGTNVVFRTRVYITTNNGRTVLSSYDEPPWVVPDTSSPLTLRDIRGAAVANTTYLRNGLHCINVANSAWSEVTCPSGTTITWSSMTNPWNTYTSPYSTYH